MAAPGYVTELDVIRETDKSLMISGILAYNIKGHKQWRLEQCWFPKSQLLAVKVDECTATINSWILAQKFTQLNPEDTSIQPLEAGYVPQPAIAASRASTTGAAYDTDAEYRAPELDDLGVPSPSMDDLVDMYCLATTGVNV